LGLSPARNSHKDTSTMLAAIAERIGAFGPRFRLPLEAISAIEAQAGRKQALAFARQHDELEFKLLAAVMGDVAEGLKLLAEYAVVTSTWPPNARKVKRLRRRLDKVLVRIEGQLG
jgi:hypothetical protein